jgi:septum formation inhibitor MinC
VLGDVNADSEVIAGGDVFVWGSLRGDVTAGSEAGAVQAESSWTT